MKPSTAYNHYVRLRERLATCYACARISGSPHSVLLASVKADVWQDPALAKCPSWVRVSLAEFDRTAYEDLHKNWLAWLFPTESGPKAWESLSDDERLSFTRDGKTGSHYWLAPALVGGRSAGTMADGVLTRVYTVTGKTFN